MQKTITTKEACPCVLKRKLSIVTALPMSSITRRLGDYMHHNNIHCLLTKKIILYRFFFKKKKDSSLTIRFNNPARLGDCAERKQYVPKTQERVKTPANLMDVYEILVCFPSVYLYLYLRIVVSLEKNDCPRIRDESTNRFQ